MHTTAKEAYALIVWASDVGGGGRGGGGGGGDGVTGGGGSKSPNTPKTRVPTSVIGFPLKSTGYVLPK